MSGRMAFNNIVAIHFYLTKWDKMSAKPIRFADFAFLVKSDLYRYSGKISLRLFIKNALIRPGFKYTLWMRLCAFLKSRSILKYFVFHIAYFVLSRYSVKYGIDIPYNTKIGSGLFIGHSCAIVVNSKTIIGKNCNLSHGVTLGQGNRGTRKGFPVIGNNVYIGPGAKLIGSVTVGDNVAIGANCVLTKEAPMNAVIVGVPGKVISYDGSTDYINNIDYE